MRGRQPAEWHGLPERDSSAAQRDPRAALIRQKHPRPCANGSLSHGTGLWRVSVLRFSGVFDKPVGIETGPGALLGLGDPVFDQGREGLHRGATAWTRPR